ncbi:hypothetical protein E1A91_A09G262000v1, partial [Gossypium mustelinum]
SMDDFLKEIDDNDENYECLLEENDDDDGDIDDENYIDDRQSQIDTWNFYDHPLFEQDYRCLPLSFHDKINDDLSVGNRIIMPSMDLEFIIENQVPLPLQFEIHNLSEGKFSHCGVLEFSGHEDGVVFLPDWMMENLQLKACDFVYMKNKKLEQGSYIKIQPHTSDFISIPNPKAVLEENLRKFCCLTKGDTIIISHGSKDCNVDFAPALDYEEHAIPVSINFGLKKKEEKEEQTQKSEFKPFTGLARKLNAEPKIGRNREVDEANSKRSSICKSEVTSQNKETDDKPKFQAFSGRSYTLER